MEPTLFTRASRLSRTMAARLQILAERRASRQRLRRSQFVLLLRPARGRGGSRKIKGDFSRWLQHRLGACAPSGDSPRCSFNQCQRSKTPLGAQTGSLCSAFVPLKNEGFLRNACTSNPSCIPSVVEESLSHSLRH